MAEETGLIVQLGQWVLTEACRQAAEWRREHPGFDLVTSVNLAVRQVRDPAIVGEVRAILEETGLDPAQLQLELTESAVMGTGGQPLETLHALADLGVRIAIDDFGTGYSNLAYLRSLPVHSLKLAGSFVAGLRPPEGTGPGRQGDRRGLDQPRPRAAPDRNGGRRRDTAAGRTACWRWAATPRRAGTTPSPAPPTRCLPW